MSSHYPPTLQQESGNPDPYSTPTSAPQGTDPVAILGLVFAFLFWPVGLILSLIGIARTGRGKRAGRGLAVAGAIVSVAAGAILVAVVAAIAGAADEAATEMDAAIEELDADLAEAEAALDAAPVGDDAAAVAEAPAAEAADVTVGLGQPATVDGVTFTVNSEECGVTTLGDEFLSVDAQGQFCLFAVTVANGGNEAFLFDSSSVTGYIGDAEYSADGEAAFYVDENSDAFLEEINPGNTVEATVVFDVPADTQLERLELSAGFLALESAVVTLR